MLADVTQCPKCSTTLPREQGHKGKPDRNGWFETLLVCVSCGVGWYTLWQRVHGQDRADFTLTYEERTEPIEFGKFLSEIETCTGLDIDVCSYAAA